MTDRLVLALGAEAKVDSVPGSAEYSIPFTTLEDALVLQSRNIQLYLGYYVNCIKEASISENSSMVTNNREMDSDNGTTQSKFILELQPAERGLENKILEADLVLWTVGSKPLVPQLEPLDQSCVIPLNVRGQVETDETLLVKEHPRIFAIGDSAALRDSSGRQQLKLLYSKRILLVGIFGPQLITDLYYHSDKFIIKGSQSRHEAEEMSSSGSVAAYTPVYVGAQSGLMEADKIDKLPGQPDGVNFDQYAGYVTVDPIAGHALFYYFTEAVEDPASKPLLLWLTGGPGCSSLGHGAMTGPGPFRVNSDGKTLSRNDYAWNKVANIIFLESPVGVGFSYTNTTSDYDQIGDTKTAHESFTFLVNWLERFPEYKTRGFYISGDGYGGHYVPQLAYTILVNNKLSNQTIINLQGIAIGNGWMDDEATLRGMYDFWWTHNLIPYEIHQGITSNCNFSSTAHKSALCLKYLDKAEASRGDIYLFDINTPSCKNSSRPVLSSEGFDTCSYAYTRSYLNLMHVQEAIHANITALPYRWTACTSVIDNWKDWHPTLLPTIKLLMESNLRLWLYSGDTDARVSVTSTTYFIDKLQLSVNTSWYPWYTNGEVGGYAIGYQKLTFATVRGGGHFVPSYQPARALTIFSSFLEGKLPPNSP